VTFSPGTGPPGEQKTFTSDTLIMNHFGAKSTTSARQNCGSETAEKHCIFRCGSAWFSVAAVAVREIALLPNFARVPGCHLSLAGISRLRSEFLPVVSLNSLFADSQAPKPEPHDRLIVIQANLAQGTGHWAILISEVTALQPLETLGAPEPRSGDEDLNLLLSTAMFRRNVIRVLDPSSLYRHVRTILEKTWDNLTPSASKRLNEKNRCTV